jgi:hypothetical protein
MALHTLKDFYPNHRNELGNDELKHIDSYSVYTDNDDKSWVGQGSTGR